MSELMNLEPMPEEDLQDIKGIAFPDFLKFRQLIVTGPPGSGKSWLIKRLGGWPEEGYIDLTLKNWWRAQSLTFRPREIHLGFPFVGRDEALTVFDREWLDASPPLRLDTARVLLPPEKKSVLDVRWRRRFVFEFLIPPADKILQWRRERTRREVHPVDQGVTLEEVERQIAVYQEAALHFRRSGMLVYVRDDFEGKPMVVVVPERSESLCTPAGQREA